LGARIDKGFLEENEEVWIFVAGSWRGEEMEKADGSEDFCS
jgi:hypothetical protein